MFSVISFCLAGGPPPTIIVEAHKDTEVYVAPIKIKNKSGNIEPVIGDYSVFGYASMHSRNAKVKKGCCSSEPLSIRHEPVKVFSKDTISYVWDNCEYEKDPKGCSYKNNHYLLETYITVSDSQIVVEMFMFDTDLQIISRGSHVSNIKIEWIKQQALESSVTENPGLQTQPQPGVNCQGPTCNQVLTTIPNSRIRNPNSLNTTNISKPKEEKPIKWEIPPTLLDKNIQQASLGLWLGVTFSLE
tara:strand:+ start:2944 stop:3675 length:732 start_codon:yes stop_codon:yes gene_type:complete